MQRCKEPLECELYIRMTRKFGWSKNVRIHQIPKELKGQLPSPDEIAKLLERVQ